MAIVAVAIVVSGGGGQTGDRAGSPVVDLAGHKTVVDTTVAALVGRTPALVDSVTQFDILALGRRESSAAYLSSRSISR